MSDLEAKFSQNGWLTVAGQSFRKVGQGTLASQHAEQLAGGGKSINHIDVLAWTTEVSASPEAVLPLENKDAPGHESSGIVSQQPQETTTSKKGSYEEIFRSQAQERARIDGIITRYQEKHPGIARDTVYAKIHDIRRILRIANRTGDISL